MGRMTRTSRKKNKANSSALNVTMKPAVSVMGAHAQLLKIRS